MRAADLSVIRKLDLFSSLEEEHFAALTRGAYLQRVPPRLLLIEEGEPADFLHVIVEGAVELFARGNLRETTIAIAEPVSTFILAAVLKDSVYLMSARTLLQSRILLIPSENVRAMMEENSAFASAMVREFATRYREIVKDLKHQKLRTAVERLANYLLRENRKQGDKGDLTLPMEKRMLASLLGMTAENLSRAFATLKPYGVDVDGGEIRLTRIESLSILAKPSSLIDDPNS
jgi:CRP/FNR family transcriptional activator FtrB